MPESKSNSAAIAGSSPVPGSPSYIPFGDAWEKEVIKNPKAAIVAMLRKACADRDHAREVANASMRESRLLAMLAAKTPQFFNPLVAMEAEEIRDRILRVADPEND